MIYFTEAMYCDYVSVSRANVGILPDSFVATFTNYS